MPRALMCDGCGATAPLQRGNWLEVATTGSSDLDRMLFAPRKPSVLGIYCSLACLHAKAGEVLANDAVEEPLTVRIA